MCDHTDVTAQELAMKLADYIEKRYKDSNSISGVKSGFPTIDAITHGFQKGNLITICSNLCYYKNCFVMQLLHNIITKDKSRFGFVSYTMNEQQFGLAMLYRETLIPVSKMVTGMMNEQEVKNIQKAIETIFTSNVVIPRVCSFSFDELCNIIRESVERYDLRVIYIDSLNTIPIEKEFGSQKNRIMNIIKKLKMLAVELDISIITDYFCYENIRDIFGGNIDNEILVQKTSFVYTYSDIVLQLQNITEKKGICSNRYELEICCSEYGLGRCKYFQFDSKEDKFLEEEEK